MRTRRRRRSLPTVTALTALTLGAVACSDDDDGGAGATPTVLEKDCDEKTQVAVLKKALKNRPEGPETNPAQRVGRAVIEDFEARNNADPIAWPAECMEIKTYWIDVFVTDFLVNADAETRKYYDVGPGKVTSHVWSLAGALVDDVLDTDSGLEAQDAIEALQLFLFSPEELPRWLQNHDRPLTDAKGVTARDTDPIVLVAARIARGVSLGPDCTKTCTTLIPGGDK